VVAIMVVATFFTFIYRKFTMALTKFKTDVKSVNEGIDIKLMDSINSDGTIPTVTVARMSSQNKKYMETIRKFNDAQSLEYGVISLDKFTPEQSKQLNIDTFVESIVLGWENFEFSEGVKTPYSKENCRNILCSDEWFDLKDRIEKEAVKSSNFSAELLDKKAKN
jgi:hypothetical protein